MKEEKGKKFWQMALVFSLLLHAVAIVFAGHMWLTAMRPVREEPLELVLASAVVPLTGRTVSPPLASVAEPAGLAGATAGAADPARSTSAVSTGEFTVTETVPAAGPAYAEPAATSAASNTAPSGGSSPAAAGPVPQSGAPASGRIIPPQVLRKVDPVYPEDMRQSGRGGTVIVRLQVQRDGTPESVTVGTSSGFAALDQAALQAVRQWRFVPARDEGSGRAISCMIQVPVRFRLQ